MVLGDFSDGYGVEFLVVHVFDDDLGVFDSYDDAYMSVVGVIPVSFELNDGSYSGSFTSGYSLCFRITDPLVCISSPGYILVLCDKGGTVSPCKSSVKTCVCNLICFVSLFYSRICIKKTF